MATIAASDEQRIIIDSVKAGNNVIVDSVAGSGKTTLIQFIATEMPEKEVQVFTYNRRLMDESNARFADLPNARVFTYHSFVSRYYCPAKDDVGINRALSMPPKKSIPAIDILILDEAQDITPVYYKLVCKILRDLPTIPQLCIVGDRYQSIYEYSGADYRFLMHADKIFTMSKLPWCRHIMHCSYRVTEVIAKYINEGVLGFDRIVAHKKGGAKVQHFTVPVFAAEKIYKDIFKPLLREYSHKDIYVLMASINSKSNSPSNKLANYLSGKNIPIGFTCDKGHEKLQYNKLIFSSFHQSKGLENKVVVVFGFDQSYFTYFAKDSDGAQCNNALYVALTRAKERLILISDENSIPFSFLKSTPKLCDYYGKVKLSEKKDRIRTWGVTAILKRLKENTVKEIVDEFVPHTVISASNESINLPHFVENKYEGLEIVSDINGIALPIWAAYKTIGPQALVDILNENKILGSEVNEKDKLSNLLGCLAVVFNKLEVKKSKKNITNDKDKDEQNRLLVQSIYAFVRNVDIPMDKFLQFATALEMHKTKLNYRFNQIANYKWLDSHIADKSIERYSKILTKDSKFEIPLLCTYSLNEKKDELNGDSVIGVADCITGDTMWEFKACKENEPQHLLQLAIYAYLNFASNRAANVTKYKIFNVVDNYTAEIHVTEKSLCRMMDKVMKCVNSNGTESIDDSTFFKNIEQYDKDMRGKVIFYMLRKDTIIYNIRGKEKITKARTESAKITFMNHAIRCALLVSCGGDGELDSEMLDVIQPEFHVSVTTVIDLLEKRKLQI